jgi:choline dehydrogenase
LPGLVINDPRDVPNINFNYFDSGSGNWSYGLAAVVEGMQFARDIAQQY